MSREKMMSEDKVGECAAAHGFECRGSSALPEIQGRAFIMEHSASGARLLYLQNEDNNKGFSITFKTPAADDTGVFHILEHSVLCGSRKFPVKEPFVNLLKSSMQTFLNAMTFPDKTMYPVASTNEKDLLNLMDVYMDAVFYPNIYRDPNIFKQEGWRYELAGEADGPDGWDGSGERPALLYNGVVFNEMKGALSDPESVLYDTLSAALFPDTTYRFESGGTPKAIPTLTYESFLDTHRRHYRPDNSYIVLYGNLDPDRFLAFLDHEYLTPLAEEDRCPEHINPLALQPPVRRYGVKRTMATTPDNACAAWGYVIGEAKESERIIAASVLVDALMGSNEAPLKRALLDGDIADDCDAVVADSVAQPFVFIEAKGLHEDAVAKMDRIIRGKIGELAAGALDAELLEAALSHAEFTLREGNFTYADGVVYSMSALNGWLYDEDGALDYIRYEDVFASLKQKLEGTYFVDLLREIFLDNDHEAQVEIVPIDADEDSRERRHLAAIEAAMTDGELHRIAEEADRLREAQNEPDAPAALATLPVLSIDDIGEAPEEPGYDPVQEGPLRCLRHAVDTHGIVYAFKYFDMSAVTFEEMPYAAILALCLGKLDTAQHEASELDTLIQAKLGDLSFAIEVYESDETPGEILTEFMVGASALSEHAPYAASIVYEVLKTTSFEAKDKLYDLLVQRKVSMEQTFTMAGNRVAALRSTSYLHPAAVLRECVSGIDFYLFLKELLEDFDARFDELAAELLHLSARLFVDGSCLLSFAGTDADLERYKDAGAFLGEGTAPASGKLVIPQPYDKHEAFIVPSDVSYTALSADRLGLPGPDDAFSGPWLVASRILSLDYLWNEVRVVGGAYGVSFSTARSGQTVFSSFRDPNVDETIRRYGDAGAWLAAFDPSSDEFVGYIVSCAAAFDKPKKPRALIRTQDAWFITGYSRERSLAYRQQVIDTRPDQVRALGEAVERLSREGCVCVVGDRDAICASRLGLKSIDLFAD